MTDYEDYLEALHEIESSLEGLEMVYKDFHKKDYYTSSDNYVDLYNALETVRGEIKDVEDNHPELFWSDADGRGYD